MLQSIQALLAPALSERLTLVINHVLASETVATERLRPHAGRTLVLLVTGGLHCCRRHRRWPGG